MQDAEGSFRAGRLNPEGLGCPGVVPVTEYEERQKLFCCNKGGTAVKIALYNVKGRFFTPSNVNKM